MKILISLLAVALIGAGGLAVTARKDVETLRKENDALRAELKTLKEQTEAAATAQGKARDYEIQKLKADAADVVRLRAENSQLRQGAKDAEKLRMENSQLRTEGQKFRAAAASAAAPSPEAPKPDAAPTSFPKDSWTMAGYATPESAIVSAMWAMSQGNPKAYFDSLTPAEQQRILKSWEGKTEEEIAAKHLADAARIESLNIVGRQVVSPNEIWLTVSAPGPDGTPRTMLVPMISEDGTAWKFDGFKRPAGGIPKTGGQGR